MFRGGSKLLLIAGAVLASDSCSFAQPASGDSDPYMRCGHWTPVATDPRNTVRFVIPVSLSETGEAVSAPGHVGGRPGIFVIPKGVLLGFLGTANGNEVTTGQFTVASGSSILFVPDAPRRIVPFGAPATLPATSVRGGVITLPLDNIVGYPYIDCLKGDSTVAMEDYGAPSGKLLADKFGKSVETKSGPKTRVGDPSTHAAAAGGRLSVVESERPGSKSSIEDIFSADNPRATSKRVGSANVPATEGAPKTPEKGSAGLLKLEMNTSPTKIETSASAIVCSADGLKPVAALTGATFASPQMVGIRSLVTEVSGFDYLDVTGDAISIEEKYDVADSVGKLIVYEPVATVRQNSSSPLLVYVDGVDQSRAKRPAVAHPKMVRVLRVIIVGGAQETSISGLNLVDAQLQDANGPEIRLSAEWHIVDQDGNIEFFGQFKSFAKLVDAATEMARGRRPDVLNEAQLTTLITGFETLLTRQANIVDRVFWIKGAYPIPGSFPSLFEKFITSVSSSSSVAHTPAGRAVKWLVVATARMPGFSIAYLKEPVYSYQVGDVLEESDGSNSPRRLIADPALLATRLRTSIAAPAVAENDSRVAVASSLTGRLVFDAKDMFVERGYVLSAEAVSTLRGHLQHVAELWNGAGVNLDVLAELSRKIGKASPTIVDILQIPDEKSYPRLPRALPEWAWKSVKDLNARDMLAVEKFVQSYANGAVKLEQVLSKRPAGDQLCGLFYVPDKLFGFSKI